VVDERLKLGLEVETTARLEQQQAIDKVRGHTGCWDSRDARDAEKRSHSRASGGMPQVVDSLNTRLIKAVAADHALTGEMQQRQVGFHPSTCSPHGSPQSLTHTDGSRGKGVRTCMLECVEAKVPCTAHSCSEQPTRSLTIPPSPDVERRAALKGKAVCTGAGFQNGRN